MVSYLKGGSSWIFPAGSSSPCLEVSPPLYVFSKDEAFMCPSALPWVDHCPSEGSKHRENAGFFSSSTWFLMKKCQPGVTSADTTQLRWRGPSQAGSRWRSHCFLLPGTFWSCDLRWETSAGHTLTSSVEQEIKLLCAWVPMRQDNNPTSKPPPRSERPPEDCIQILALLNRFLELFCFQLCSIYKVFFVR